MKDMNIEIKGFINQTEVVVNPLFVWDDPNYDYAFTVELSKDSTVIDTKDVNEAMYQYNKALDANSNYSLKVTGKTSNHSNVLEFKTVVSYENNITSIKLNNPFMSNMVIQRNTDTIVSGVGPKNQLITLSIGEEMYYNVSDNNGAFEITLPARKESFNPVTITLANGLGVTSAISNVLFGDVYLFSGQSNMQWPTENSDYTSTDINYLKDSYLRFFCQDVVQSPTKLEEVKNGRWFIPDEYNVKSFSAIATMTGALLGHDLKTEVPIGIITAYQGDTNIANWMSPEYYNGTCSTKYIHYNAMVYPLRHTKLSGVVWYQGCNNSAAGNDYKDLLLSLFDNYRDLFNTENLPFYVIGLACYDGDNGNNFDFSYVRESQALACEEDSHAYFISTCDNGDPTYIHPRLKHYICERVAKSIEASIYDKDYYTEGPKYKSHTVNGNVVTIELYNNEGLRNIGDVKNFYLAGSDGKYYEANVSLQNNKIVASTPKVENPVYIKYGFGKSPFVNIFNKDGFSMIPFRTDSYNTNIDLLDYNKTDDYYFHPDGSQMAVVIENNNLLIKKQNDGKGYGSVRLDKWGSVAYHPEGISVSLVGKNSGAAISFRFIEGESYEIWAYKVIDDFEGLRTFTGSIGDLSVVYNKQNGIFEPQKITYVEIMIEKNGEVDVEVAEFRFIEMERTEPQSFIISTVSEQDDVVNVSLSNSLFASSYTLTLTKGNSTTPLFNEENTDGVFSISKANLAPGEAYYLNATAKNELGETNATNNGFVFYLKSDDIVIVCNFDFKNQDALDAYISSSMSVHDGLKCSLDENGVKIVSTGQGWQQFIFKLDTGVGAGMTKLEFSCDLSNYKGQLVMQLADTSWGVYQYSLTLTPNENGKYVLNFSDFKKDGKAFTTQTLMWVMFNFNDTVGDGYVLLDDVRLIK